MAKLGNGDGVVVVVVVHPFVGGAFVVVFHPFVVVFHLFLLLLFQ